MQISTKTFSSTACRQPAAEQGTHAIDPQARLLLNRALYDTVAWDKKNRARRKRLGLR